MSVDADRLHAAAPGLLNLLVAELAERLAPMLADEIAGMLARRDLGTRDLVSLDELVEQLPSEKRPETWKRWLYDHLRRGEVGGAVKLGGSWFFDVEQTRTWVRNNAR